MNTGSKKGETHTAEQKIKPAELLFDGAYLAAVAVLGFLLLRGDERGKPFGFAACALLFGDAFHLLPRMLGLNTAAKGLGKAVASVTMTLFYVVLLDGLTPALGSAFVCAAYALAALRVLLCLLPPNKWRSGDSSPGWSVLRNAPFAAVGLLAAAGFIRLGGARELTIGWLILASFAFYLPVVLWAAKKPALGILMLPKSMAYAAILLTAFFC